ncbi:MAG: hypothetical protein V4669_13885 [Pseudomonadota bacterium]
MKLATPTITVQSAEGPDWLVTLHQQFSEHESMSITLALQKNLQANLREIQAEVMEKALAILQMGLAERPVP